MPSSRANHDRQSGGLRAVRSGLLALTGLLGSAILAVGTSTQVLPGQVAATTSGAAAGAPALPAIQSAADVTFQLLAAAPRRHDRTVTQTRRFLAQNGTMAGVHESLEVKAIGVPSPAFRLCFQGVEGQLPGSPVEQSWNATYVRCASLFHEHNSFQVHDADLAAANYTLHDFGSGMRAGRPIRRVVVFPRLLDKAIWVLELDTQTAIPLYSAEYDSSFRLLGELVVTSFQLSVAPFVASQPAMLLTRHPDFATAVRQLPTAQGLVDPGIGKIAPDFRLRFVQVTEDPANARKSLVLGYTDGIDEVFVIQTPGTTDIFSVLPGAKGAVPAANAATIARFRDRALSILTFWHQGVTFQMVGRGSMLRLEQVAKRICVQAITGR